MALCKFPVELSTLKENQLFFKHLRTRIGSNLYQVLHQNVTDLYGGKHTVVLSEDNSVITLSPNTLVYFTIKQQINNN